MREPEPAPRRPGLVWCSTAIAVATATLALGNAESARNWAEGLKPTPLTEPVREAAEQWASFTRAAGLSRVREGVRQEWEHRHDVDWTGLAPKPTTLAAGG